MSDEKTPVVSEAPERRRAELWQTTQTPEGVRPSPRQQRDARAYAGILVRRLACLGDTQQRPTGASGSWILRPAPARPA